MPAFTTFLRRPGTRPWLALMTATIITWILATNHTLLGGATAATVAVLVIAFVKVQIVGAHFMELRHAPRLLSLLFSAWVLITASVIITIYLAR